MVDRVEHDPQRARWPAVEEIDVLIDWRLRPETHRWQVVLIEIGRTVVVARPIRDPILGEDRVLRIALAPQLLVGVVGDVDDAVPLVAGQDVEVEVGRQRVVEIVEEALLEQLVDRGAADRQCD